MIPGRARPSPSKQNPFARATTDQVVARRRLLPTVVSPVRAAPADPAFADNESSSLPSILPSTDAIEADKTPGKAVDAPDPPPSKAKPTSTPSTKARTAWRMLWRGGLEVGPDGWRLEGITFFAQLSFPATTPSHLPPTPHPSSPAMQTDADLCLSLESLRGRKFLSVRGVEPLGEDEKLEGVDGGVQMSIANPLVAAFFTGLLCRNPKLSPNGRTLTAVVIGLGDEGQRDAVLVYGQLQPQGEGQPTLRLNVGRRAPPPPSEKKIRPGEPLPRAPLLFPDHAPTKRPPPIPRPLSRSVSTASMYAPQVKRPKVEDDDGDRRRKSRTQDEEDIFGLRRSASLAPSTRSGRAPSAAPSSRSTRAPSAAPSNRSTRAPSAAPTLLSIADEDPPKKTPKQVLDNKATVRKQTLVALESRGCPREHDQFKDVFSTTIRGVYFAFRDSLESGPLDKSKVQDIVARHLDMYFPQPEAAAAEPSPVPNPVNVRDTEEVRTTDEVETSTA